MHRPQLDPFSRVLTVCRSLRVTGFVSLKAASPAMPASRLVPSAKRTRYNHNMGNGKKARVLIVEDDTNERRGLADLLSAWGYETQTARTEKRP